MDPLRRALEALPREYRLYFDCRWVRRTREGGRIGHADAVVAHEHRGVIAIAGGDDAPRRAIEARYALQGKMREHRASNRDWAVGHAVARCEPTPDLDPAIVLPLRDARREIDAAFAFWSGTAPGAAGLRILEDILARPRIASDEAELIRLTDEQMRLLDFLSGHTRAAIRGCAGSGKTLMAVEKARRLAAEGFSVLLVCFNRLLGRHVGSMVKGVEGIDAIHFHELCVQWARRAGLEIVGPQDDPTVGGDEFFEQTLPELLIESASRLAHRYDAVVVDEGQDFRAGWWRALEAVSRPESVLYVFYDDNQSLFVAPRGMPIDAPPFTLTRNCRQSAALHEWVARFYRGEARPGNEGPPGRSPEILRYRDEAGLHAAVQRSVEGLVREGVPLQEIVILTPHRKGCRVWDRRRAGAWSLTEAWPAPEGCLTWATVHRFKGLESTAVVLAEVEPDARSGLEAVLYVGGSRAKHRLVVVAAEGLSPL